MESDVQRSTLLRTIKLGDFYNARTDTIRPNSSIKSLRHHTITEAKDAGSCDILTKKFSTKTFSIFNMEDDQALHVLSGSTLVQGAAEFLTRERSENQCVYMIYKYETGCEKLDFSTGRGILENIPLKGLERSLDTHIVTSIVWGCYLVVALEYNRTNVQSHEKLRDVAYRIAESVSSGTMPNIHDNLICNIYADIPLMTSKLLSWKETWKILRSLHTDATSKNREKSVKISFKATPITCFLDYFGVIDRVKRPMASRETDMIQMLCNAFQMSYQEKMKLKAARKQDELRRVSEWEIILKETVKSYLDPKTLDLDKSQILLEILEKTNLKKTLSLSASRQSINRRSRMEEIYIPKPDYPDVTITRTISRIPIQTWSQSPKQIAANKMNVGQSIRVKTESRQIEGIAMSGRITECNEWPKLAAIVNLQCPCSSDKGSILWRCQKCRQYLLYAKEGHFYCLCGKGVAQQYLYKCSDPHHGANFLRNEDSSIFPQLNSLKPAEEVTMLLLGESGAGKSTWVNAFLNYCTFDNLDDAVAHNSLLYRIPSQFTLYQPNTVTNEYEKRVVKIGSDSNERHSVEGQSVTQSSKSYRFLYGNRMVNLIDTPGMGDTRGSAKDDENISNILTHLSKVQSIHGICILLKPNSARLTLTMRKCLTDVLKHTRIQGNAISNIVFCFTHARSTFYKPGDTYVSLKALLKEIDVPITLDDSTMYCMDNEAFRYLALVKDGVYDHGSEHKNICESWNHSSMEAKRLLSRIMKLQPCSFKLTPKPIRQPVLEPVPVKPATVSGQMTGVKPKEINVASQNNVNARIRSITKAISEANYTLCVQIHEQQLKNRNLANKVRNSFRRKNKNEKLYDLTKERQYLLESCAKFRIFLMNRSTKSIESDLFLSAVKVMMDEKVRPKSVPNELQESISLYKGAVRNFTRDFKMDERSIQVLLEDVSSHPLIKDELKSDPQFNQQAYMKDLEKTVSGKLQTTKDSSEDIEIDTTYQGNHTWVNRPRNAKRDPSRQHNSEPVTGRGKKKPKTSIWEFWK